MDLDRLSELLDTIAESAVAFNSAQSDEEGTKLAEENVKARTEIRMAFNFKPGLKIKLESWVKCGHDLIAIFDREVELPFPPTAGLRILLDSNDEDDEYTVKIDRVVFNAVSKYYIAHSQTAEFPWDAADGANEHIEFLTEHGWTLRNDYRRP